MRAIMGLYPVLLIILLWHNAKTEDIEDFSIESIFDQVAVPSQIINEFVKRTVKQPTIEKYSNDEFEDSTVHYENSNGFVPLIISNQNKQTQNNKDTSQLVNNIKRKRKFNNVDQNVFRKVDQNHSQSVHDKDNRRSFRIDENRDDFELLKVSNGTPSIANYDSFYDHLKATSTYSDNPQAKKKNSHNKNRERGKRIQNFHGNYEINNGNTDHNSNKNDEKKITQPKRAQNYYKTDISDNNRVQNVSIVKANSVPSTTTVVSIVEAQVIKNDKTDVINAYKPASPVQPNIYKNEFKANEQKVVPVSLKLKNSPKHAVVTEQSSDAKGNSRHYESADSGDFSNENTDYVDVTDKPRRTHKLNRKRPQNFESIKKLPKEHRQTYEDSYDDQDRRRPSTKTKSRYRQKPKQIVNEEYDNYDNYDENSSRYSNANKFNEGNGWSQITPNVEVSQSNGFQLNQIEKPKLHIIPINIMTNFDHATALDNSQGFDISNAMIAGYSGEKSSGSTSNPVYSSSSYDDDEFVASSTTSRPQISMSTSVPDIIVGHSSAHNPVRAVFFPSDMQKNLQNQGGVQSTVSPVILAVTPQTTFEVSSTLSPNIQHMLNQAQSSYLNSRPHSNKKPHKYKASGEKPYSSYFPYPHPTSRSSTPYKKRYNNGNDGEYIASASLAVSQGKYRQSHKNTRNYRTKNKNLNDQNIKSSSNQGSMGSSFNSPITQSTVVPAILHTGIGFINNQPIVPSTLLFTNPQQNAQMLQATKEALEKSIQQLQLNLQNNQYQINSLSNADSIGGASNNINSVNSLINPVQKAQLPILGAKNVEIINPNLHSNTFAIQQIPTALVTTPIPIFTTTGFISTKQPTSQDSGGPDRQQYNPIQFIPNYDLVKTQSILNNNVPQDSLTQQNLNLVSIMPGGNFYKQSPGTQVNLSNKPKLSSDLEKYAEEMFKESLRTIYNSHKWNNDIRTSIPNTSSVDNLELARLRNELLRIQNKLKNSKGNKEELEAHHSEHKIKTSKPGKHSKRPDLSNNGSHKKPIGIASSPNHQSHHNKQKSEINDYLTPPKVNSFVSHSQFQNTKPSKKRPNNGVRPHSNHDSNRLRPRQGIVMSKPKGSDSQASSLVHFRYPIRVPEKNYFSHSDHFYPQVNNYPSFATHSPSPKNNNNFKASVELKSAEGDYYDMNNQRMHNLMGLLMKNKALPAGIQQFSRQIQNDGHNQFQFYPYVDMRGFKKKVDTQQQPILLNGNLKNNRTNV
ncbi:hypothetical protein TKK_0008086 [Trichogramma kaykai]|uniref:Uncharacterized protein n=1 Tax=Trichogramma kaykai TaxID=54128 RepID=A0ABD2X6L8_9HYME